MNAIPRVFALLALLVGTAAASDGVYEIDADCVAIGCFAGDSGGFPVTLANPGSYRLTSNLTTGDIDTTLIEIDSDDVQLDLNGFSLIGPVRCTVIGSSPASCPDAGTGDGINTASTVSNLVIRNGAIRGMGRDGIGNEAGVSLNVLVSEINATENARRGIHVITGLVRDSVAHANGDTGIFSATQSLCTGNVASHNAGHGIQSCTCGNNVMSANGNNDQCGAVISKNICLFDGGACQSP